MKKLARGFIFFEIGLVLSLIIIISSLALVHFSFFERQLLKTEVQKLSQFIWFCVQRAQVAGVEKAIIFDLENNSYACDQYQEKLARGIAFGFIPDAVGPPSRPTNKLTTPLSFSNNRIIVRPDGTMEAGAIYVTNNAHNLMYAVTTPVTSVSYIRNYRYHNNQWQLI